MFQIGGFYAAWWTVDLLTRNTAKAWPVEASRAATTTIREAMRELSVGCLRTNIVVESDADWKSFCCCAELSHVKLGATVKKSQPATLVATPHTAYVLVLYIQLTEVLLHKINHEPLV